MDKGSLAGTIIMAVCCFGCAALFLGIGVWADRLEKPMHFWSGSTVDPAKVTDLAGYNHANALMWKVYSVPYWVSGVFSCLGYFSRLCFYISLAFLCLACVPGMYLLVRWYLKIEKKYILR